MENARIIEVGNIPVQDSGRKSFTEHERAMVIQFADIGSLRRAMSEGHISIGWDDTDQTGQDQ